MRFLLCFIFVLFINQLFCQIDFYIETDETCYSFGQDIYITFNLHNTTSDTVIVTFLSSFPFNYYIDDELFIIGSYAVVFDVTIPPDSTFSSIPYIHSDNVSIGNHILIGEFLCIPNNWVTDPVSITIEQVGVDFSELQPIGCQLSNYPNPFKPSGAGRSPETTISFSLAKDAKNAKTCPPWRIEIYNLKGQKVKSLDVSGSCRIDAKTTRSFYSIMWNGTGENNKPVASGLYFYKLSSGKETQVKKMLLMK